MKYLILFLLISLIGCREDTERVLKTKYPDYEIISITCEGGCSKVRDKNGVIWELTHNQQTGEIKNVIKLKDDDLQEFLNTNKNDKDKTTYTTKIEKNEYGEKYSECREEVSQLQLEVRRLNDELLNTGY